MSTQNAIRIAKAIADGAEMGKAHATRAISALGNTNALEIAGLAVGFAETIFAGIRLSVSESQASTINEMVAQIIMDESKKGKG